MRLRECKKGHFYVPRLPKAAVEHLAFRRDLTPIHAFLFEFALPFTYAFYFEIITLVPIMLRNFNLVCFLPRSNPKFFARVALGSLPYG